MALEIERKFLVRDAGDTVLPDWKRLAEDPEGTLYLQGYLSRDPDRTVRVRVAGDKARLTVKGRTTGCTRSEFEYPIPLEDAGRMLDELVLPPVLEKRRYRVPFAGHVWEVDEFEGENRGLVVAEVELESEEEALLLPAWAGEEVTGDPRYYNSALSENPYARWRTEGDRASETPND